MPSWFEGAVVVAVVGLAVFWGLRAILRSWRKGTVCSTCSDAGSCPLAGKEKPLTELKDFPSDPKCGC